MNKLKRLISLSTALIIIAVLCLSNISISALNLPDDENDVKYYYQDNFMYYIDSESLAPVIIGIKDGTKVFNIPETITCDGITYPVKDLVITPPTLFYNDIDNTLKTINVSKNIEQINFLEMGWHNGAMRALKTINIPAGAQLKSILLPSSPKLKNLNFPSNSILEKIYITGCPKLKKLSLPKTLKHCNVGKDAPKLKVKIAKGNKYLKVKGNQILSKDGKILYDLVGKKSNVTVYKTVKTIKSFDNRHVKKLILGDNVTKISKYSFGLFKNPLSLKIKGKIKAPKIGHFAFGYMKINFYVENNKVAKDLKKKLKGSVVKKAKILIGDTVVYENING